jgi:hypothetical protein
MVDTRHYFYYHHTAADTLDKIDPADLRKHVATMATLAWWLSEQPAMPPRNPAADVKERFQPHCPAPQS